MSESRPGSGVALGAVLRPSARVNEGQRRTQRVQDRERGQEGTERTRDRDMGSILVDYQTEELVTTVTSHPILCTPSRVYMQPCSPWTRPDPTRSTTGPFRPLSSPSCAFCSICDAYVSAHDALLFLSVSREHR